MEKIRINRSIVLQLSMLLLLQLVVFLKSKAADGLNAPTKTFSTGSIGDLLWLDRDGDGLQESGEPGFEGAVVVLNDPSGLIIATTVTDAFGNYMFTNVDAGLSGKSYQVWFRLPAGYRFSPKTGSMVDAGNSDVDQSTGKTPVFILLPGQVTTDVDAGIVSVAIGTLPLHRLELTAVLHGTTVDLEWVAENEMNTKHFVVQRSFDGENYSDIATMFVVGQVNTPTGYNFANDINALMSYKVVYYRIKAEDNLLRAAYSNVAPIRLSKISGIRVWPNPFVNEIRITYNGAANTMADVTINDNAGRTAWKGAFEISRGLNQLSLGGVEKLPAGIYYIRVTDKSTEQSFVERIVK